MNFDSQIFRITDRIFQKATYGLTSTMISQSVSQDKDFYILKLMKD